MRPRLRGGRSPSVRTAEHTKRCRFPRRPLRTRSGEAERSPPRAWSTHVRTSRCTWREPSAHGALEAGALSARTSSMRARAPGRDVELLIERLSELVAERIDRRVFMRRAANITFFTVAAAATGNTLDLFGGKEAFSAPQV